MKMNFLYLLSCVVFSLIAMDSGTQQPVNPLPSAILPNEDWFWINNLAYSPDGKHLAVMGMITKPGNPNFVRLWDVESDYTIYTDLDNEKPSNAALAFSADGKQLCSNALQKIKVWDLETQKVSAEYDGGRYVHSLAYSPQDPHLLLSSATVTGDALIWDLRSKEKVQTLACHTKKLLQAIWSPGDRNQVVTNQEQNCVKMWDIRTARGLKTQELPGPVGQVAYSPSGETIACALPGQIALCEASFGRLKKLSTYWQGAPTLEAPSVFMYVPQCEDLILAGMYNAPGDIGVCDLRDEKRNFCFPTIDGVMAITSPADGKWLAVAGAFTENINVYDLAAITKKMRAMHQQEDNERDLIREVELGSIASSVEKSAPAAGWRNAWGWLSKKS